MTEKETKKPTPKKAAPKKTAPKKTTPKKVEVVVEDAVEEVVVEEVAVEEVKPKRQKRAQIERNELIACRSTTDGVLVYISDRTRARFVWNDYGAIQYVEMGELLDMRASKPRFLNDVLFVVEDEEAMEILGLSNQYKDIVNFDNLEDFFKKDINSISEALDKVPKGIKESIATRARKLVESGDLDQLNKIKLIEDKLKVDLKMFAD